MRLEPRQLARDQRDLSVDLPLEAFPRLRELVAATGGPVAVRVGFRRDEHGRIRIDGRAAVSLRMVCGNCGEMGPLEIDVPISLCVVGSDEAARALGDDVDPLILTTPDATPADLFEDDLLLALPDRPCRGSLDCPTRPQTDVTEPGQTTGEVRQSPFAVLASLKNSAHE